MYSGDGTYSIDQMVDTGTCVEVYVEGDTSRILPHIAGVIWVNADEYDEYIEHRNSQRKLHRERLIKADLEVPAEILEFEETEQVIGIYDLFPALTVEPIPLINKRRLPSGFP